MKPKSVAILTLVAAVAGGCAGGHSRPHFRPASGWNLLSLHGELVATDVPIAAADRSLASPPSRTVATLPRDGVVIWAMYLRGGNPNYPAKHLPLRLDDAVRSDPFEGIGCAPAVPVWRCLSRPGSAAVRRWYGRIAGYDIDAYVFFGSDHPSSAQLAAAGAELARLTS